ncbi:MAG: ATP synthase F1 subunit epsilon [Bacillota bacterium]|nr:ATP synthase F1 subunit epsilon [Bacillota bacterium]
MAKSVHLEVITPSKLFYKGDVELVIVRTVSGDEGFMARHSWACKLLIPGELWIQEAGEKDFKVAAVAGGYVDVTDNIVIFTDAAEWASDIDPERARAEKEKAETWLKEGHEDDHEIMLAKIAIAKNLNRMNIASGGGRRRRA